MQRARDYEFHATGLAPFSDEKSITAIARTRKGAKRYVLQRFRPATVLSHDYFKKVDPFVSEKQMMRLQKIATP